MKKSSRLGTCLHEAGHAVISHILGVRFLHVAVLDDARGEMVPESSACQSCIEYYERSSPIDDAHSRVIQDDLRRQAAIAVAGEIAESLLSPESCVDDSELSHDRQVALCRASFIHFWAENRCRAEACWESGRVCPFCEAFLAQLRSVVKAELQKTLVSRSVESLAVVLSERGRLDCGEVTDLVGKDLGFGSFHVDALPSAPSPA